MHNEKQELPKIKKGQIKHVVFDADNTLWDWVSMHLKGIEAMADALAKETGINLAELKASMSRAYGRAGTLDYKALVQDLDVLQVWMTREIIRATLKNNQVSEIVKQITTGKITPETIGSIQEILSADHPHPTLVEAIGLAHTKFADLLLTAHKTYTNVRNEHFRLYPHVRSVLSVLNENRIKVYIVTNAPLKKTIRRMNHPRLGGNLQSFIAAIYGKDDRAEKVLPSYEMVQRKGKEYDTTCPQKELPHDQSKPNIDLASLLELTRDEVKKNLVVVGDKLESDMQLALNNGCIGFYARYGTPKKEQIDALGQFAPVSVVQRNADIFTEEEVGTFLSIHPRIITLNSPEELLQHLGLKTTT